MSLMSFKKLTKRLIPYVLVFILFLLITTWLSLSTGFDRNKTVQNQKVDTNQFNQLQNTPVIPSSVDSTASILPSNDILYPEQQWLDQVQFREILDLLRIQSIISIPKLGTPYLAVDWNSTRKTADAGRKIVLGFERTHSWGSRWGGLTLEYSTYDFKNGTESESFANENDYVRLKRMKPNDSIEVNGVIGLVKYSKSPHFDFLRKNVIFPFKDYSIVVTYNFQNKSENDLVVIDDLNHGIYPESDKEYLLIFDSIVHSLKFSDKQ